MGVAPQSHPTARSTRYRAPGKVSEVSLPEFIGDLSTLELKYLPSQLFAAGDLSLLRNARRVAIVGSRTASSEGLRRAAKLAAQLAKADVTIVSGLAAGVDRAAHEGALEAGGRTIAVIGTPLDRCYPKSHASLQETIYRDHLVVSQFPPCQPTFPSDFVKRNRTMALLSHTSVIIEANDGSGSLSQAAETQRLGHQLFFLQSVLDNTALTWPASFRANGARALGDVEEILRVLDEPRTLALL